MPQGCARRCIEIASLELVLCRITTYATPLRLNTQAWNPNFTSLGATCPLELLELLSLAPCRTREGDRSPRCTKAAVDMRQHTCIRFLDTDAAALATTNACRLLNEPCAR